MFLKNLKAGIIQKSLRKWMIIRILNKKLGTEKLVRSGCRFMRFKINRKIRLRTHAS